MQKVPQRIGFTLDWELVFSCMCTYIDGDCDPRCFKYAGRGVVRQQSMESLQREDGLNCSDKIVYFYNYCGLVTIIIHEKGATCIRNN